MTREPSTTTEARMPEVEPPRKDDKKAEGHLHCDRCGAVMFGERCKIVCPNCGNRFDCSDLNLYFD